MTCLYSAIGLQTVDSDKQTEKNLTALTASTPITLALIIPTLIAPILIT